MNKLGILIVVALLCILPVYGLEAGYILRNTGNAEVGYLNAMSDMNITVTTIDADHIGSYDLSQFDFLLVGDDQFDNADEIPVNDYPTIVANSYDENIEIWHWANQVTQFVNVNPPEAINTNNNHLITAGIPQLPNFIQIYTQCCFDFPPIGIPLWYLKRNEHPSDIDTIISTIISEHDAVIGTIEPGDHLRDSFIATNKAVFFGAVHSDYWTDDAELLFKNSIIWLTSDTTSPVINNITVTEITTNSARVNAETDDPTNATLTITREGFPVLTLYDTNFSETHSFPIIGLLTETTYEFRVTVCNEANYCTTSDLDTFTTLGEPDLTPPVISDLVSTPDTESVEITFTTDDLSDVTINYGETTSLGTLFNDNNFGQTHVINIGGLNDETQYYYNITVCNPSGTCETYGPYDFTTEKIFDTTPPVISNIVVSEIAPSSAKVSYDTDDEANMTIQYGLTDQFGSTLSNTNFATHFDQIINGLTYNTIYFFQIESCNEDNYCSISETQNFTTAPSDDIYPPEAPTNFRAEINNSDEKVILKWDASISDDVAGYRIYKAGDLDEFNFQNPNATVNDTTFHDVDSDMYRILYYIVRAYDEVGNEENNSNIVVKYSKVLPEGYNSFSVPIEPFDRSLNAVLHHDEIYSPISEVYEWTGSGFIKAIFDLNEDDNWINNGIDEMIPGVGYFFNVEEVTSIEIVGTLISDTYEITLDEGMNFVGWPSLENKAFEHYPEFFANISEVSMKSPYHDGTFSMSTNYGEDGWYSEDNRIWGMFDGAAFWVKADQQTTWVFEP
ncbi:fibronectin type III domain-containing protein [Nanoarchaeota archaeon]